MKKHSVNLLRNQTIIFIISSMAMAFLVTVLNFLFYFNNLTRDNQTKAIYLSVEKKTLELNTFFNSANKLLNDAKSDILTLSDNSS